MEAMLIINPSAGSETAPDFADELVEKLEGMFTKVTVKYTEGSGDATQFARTACDEKYDSVFAMGGDGTVNEVINGLAEQDYRPKFGFFPLGTVNDLARALNIPLDPDAAIANLSREKLQKIDIGKINQQYFMNVVAIGMIPEAINQVAVEDKTRLGKLAYFIAGAKEVLKNQSFTFTLNLDENVEKVTSSTIIVALTNSVGGFEHLLKDAKVDDGRLHLLYLKDETLLDTIKSVPDLLKGVTASTNYLGYYAFQNGKIAVAENVDIHTNIDGDEGPDLPIELKVLPEHLTVYGG